MKLVNNKIKQRLYTLSFLATALWAGMVALLTVELATYDRLHQIPYYWILLYTSVLSLAGCIAWSFSWPHWRKVLITTTTLYLILYLLKFYKHTLVWSEESFWEAIKYVFYMHWLLITGYLSKGLVMQASIITFIEWIMPALQLILLVKFVSFSNPSFKRDA
jgi:hypothetical protein